METSLSNDARRIIEAGLNAAAQSDAEPMLASDEAIRKMIGQLGLEHKQDSESIAIDCLTEIAQLHVRQKIKS